MLTEEGLHIAVILPYCRLQAVKHIVQINLRASDTATARGPSTELAFVTYIRLIIRVLLVLNSFHNQIQLQQWKIWCLQEEVALFAMENIRVT